MGLLERDDALGALDAAVASADVGHGRVVLISGPAGIGKTALVQTFLHDRLPGHSAARVIVGVCDDLSTPSTYGALRDAARGLGPQLQSALREQTEGDVMALLLAELGRPPTPTIFVLEDLHWADEATLDVLLFLTRRIDDLPAVLVLTYRSDDLVPEHPLRRLLGRVPTHASIRLELPPLSVEAVAVLAADEPSTARATALHRLTGGNPFYIRELLAEPRMHHGVPLSVVDAVLGRVGRLSPQSRELLQFVSLVPGRVEVGLLDACLPGWAELAAEPERRGMLHTDGVTVSFAHEIARRAVERSVPRVRAAAWHRQILEVLRADSAVDPARLAHHAAAGGDEDALLMYGLAAARQALHASANREAVAQLARIDHLLGRLPLEDQATAAEERYRASFDVGLYEQGMRSVMHALELRRQLGDIAGSGRLLAHQALSSWVMGRSAEARATSREAVDQLSALPPGRDLALALAVDAALAMTAWDGDYALDRARRAAALAEECGDDAVLAFALDIIGAVQLGRGQDASKTVDRAVDVAKRAGDHQRVCVALTNAAETAVEQHRHPMALHYLDLGSAYADEHEVLSTLTYITAVRSRLELERGRWDDALALARSVLDPPGESPVNRINALITAALVAVRRGADDAETAVEELMRAAETTGELQRILPAALARAELADLRGRLAKESPSLRELYDRVAPQTQDWPIAEVARWLARAQPGVVSAEDWHPDIGLPHRLELAGQWLEAAAKWESLGCVYQAAEARIRAGTEESLLAAIRELDALGAVPLAERARQQLRRFGVRVPRPRQPRPETRAHPAGLTPRQVEVLNLVAQGLTNAEIAERLVLSVRTVDHHVAAVLTKLGVSTRRQAASLARDLGLALT